MTNYLNQIESDLYKLNSITNGSGEVVEMVAELKEKYEKAKALERIVELIKKRRDYLDLFFNKSSIASSSNLLIGILV